MITVLISSIYLAGYTRQNIGTLNEMMQTTEASNYAY